MCVRIRLRVRVLIVHACISLYFFLTEKLFLKDIKINADCKMLLSVFAKTSIRFFPIFRFFLLAYFH